MQDHHRTSFFHFRRSSIENVVRNTTLGKSSTCKFRNSQDSERRAPRNYAEPPKEFFFNYRKQCICPNNHDWDTVLQYISTSCFVDVNLFQPNDLLVLMLSTRRFLNLNNFQKANDIQEATVCPKWFSAHADIPTLVRLLLTFPNNNCHLITPWPDLQVPKSTRKRIVLFGWPPRLPCQVLANGELPSDS